MKGTNYRGAEMVEKIRHRGIVPYFRGGFCAVHVEDVVDGIEAALEQGRPGERYILGGENLSYRSLAQMAAAAMNLQRHFVPVPPLVTGLAAMLMEPLGRLINRRPWFTTAVHYCTSRFMYYDSSKARAALGYAPRSFGAILDECIRSDRLCCSGQ
jgi:dihydroflavonol-4-reductase